MNADEIVKELREMATYDCGYEEQSDTAIRAADIIESLQAQLIEKDDIICSIRNYETEAEKQMGRDGEQIKELLAENERLTAQLTASQRRHKAAVEDMKHIANEIEKCHYKLEDGEDEVSSLNLGRCDVCTKICHEDKPCKFEWRGPQEG